MTNVQIHNTEVSLYPAIHPSIYEELKDKDGFININFFENPEEELYCPDVVALHKEAQEAIERTIFKGKVRVLVHFNPVKRLAKMVIVPIGTHSARNYAWTYRTLLTNFRKEIESKTASYSHVEMERVREDARRLMFL